MFLQNGDADSESLQAFLKSTTKGNLFTIKIGCASCGTRLEISRMQIDAHEDYEFWHIESSGDVALCTACARKDMSSDISGDRDRALVCVQIDIPDDVADHLGAEPEMCGWATSDELRMIHRQVRQLEDAGSEASVQVIDEAHRRQVRMGGKHLNQNL